MSAYSEKRLQTTHFMTVAIAFTMIQIYNITVKPPYKKAMQRHLSAFAWLFYTCLTLVRHMITRTVFVHS